MNRYSSAILAAAVCLSFAACSSEPKQTATPAPAAAAAATPTPANPVKYDLKGKVVAVDKAGKKLTVDGEAIANFMSAMTMPYPVKDEHLLDNLTPGET